MPVSQTVNQQKSVSKSVSLSVSQPLASLSARTAPSAEEQGQQSSKASRASRARTDRERELGRAPVGLPIVRNRADDGASANGRDQPNLARSIDQDATPAPVRLSRSAAAVPVGKVADSSTIDSTDASTLSAWPRPMPMPHTVAAQWMMPILSYPGQRLPDRQVNG